MEDCYVIRPEYKYEIFFATITSTLFVYMVPLMKALNGTKVHVDAVYFDDMNDVTADIIKSMLPDFMDWKIKETDRICSSTFWECFGLEWFGNPTV